MSDEQELQQPQDTQEPVEQHEQIEQVTTEAAENKEGEKEQAPSRTFTQEELDEAVTKRLAKERNKFEAEMHQLQQQLQLQQQQRQALEPQQSYEQEGAQQQAANQTPAQPQITHELMEAQYMVRKSEEAMQAKHKDYDQVIAEGWMMAAQQDPVFIRACMQSGDPAAFAYEVGKNHQDRLGQIMKLQDPIARYDKLAELRYELKSRAQAPIQTKAPAPMQDERGTADYEAPASVDAMLEARRRAAHAR